MQTDSSSLDTLKDSLSRAVDADYNVIDPESVLDIISQLERTPITRDQLQTTRLGREINTIRQKIDARKKSAGKTGECSQSILDIAQRAKKLLRSWQGLLNTSQTDTNSLSSTNLPATPVPVPTPPPPPLPPSTPSTNGETHDSPSEDKPRLIVKVKINPSITSNSNNDNNNTKSKRKNDVEYNGLSNKRHKTHNDMPISPPAPISPVSLTESSNSLPRLKTTQQLLLEMQMNQPDVLSTQAPTVNAILQNQIIDESLHEPSKVDYSALHHGRETTNTTINTNYQKLPLPTIISPTNSTGSTSKRSALVRRSSTSNNWENGSSAGGSPVSPSSSSSSSIASTTLWPLAANIPEPPSSIPIIPKKKRRRKPDETDSQITTTTSSPPPPSSTTTTSTTAIHLEQSTPLSPDLETLCSSFRSVAELTEAHRQRILAEHDTRELEARPELLLVPIDQLAFVYERERINQQSNDVQIKSTSLTTVDTFEQPTGLIALPFIDCPLEFDLVLDELVVQQPTMDM